MHNEKLINIIANKETIHCFEDLKINSARKRIISIKDNLNSYFLERFDIINAILISIASKKHMILIGEPGLAKTAILKALSQHIKGLRFFDYQMTPSTEINDLLSKNTANKGQGIDKCEIALIDEFFKGPSATLNSLLSIMNERVIYNPEPVKIPLISVFATSNERPDKSEGSNLLPLYDRFLLRKEVLPIMEVNNFKKLLNIEEEYNYNGIELNLDELYDIINEASHIDMPDEIYNAIHIIREELKHKQVVVSDRRWREIIKIIKVNAFMNFRKSAEVKDIKAVESSLWTFYSDIRSVRNVINKITG